jgi:hypothetical protein
MEKMSLTVGLVYCHRKQVYCIGYMIYIFFSQIYSNMGDMVGDITNLAVLPSCDMFCSGWIILLN